MNTYIVYRKELFIKAIGYIIIWALIGLAATYLLKSRIISIACMIIMIAPIFFIRIIMKRFIRKIHVQLGLNHFTITTHKKNGEIDTRKTFELNELQSYSIQFPNNKFNSIIFKLIGGKRFEYSFFKNQKSDDQFPTDKLIESFHSLIHNYNSVKNREQKVIFKPSFFASRNGLLYIVGLVILFLVAIFLQLLYKPKTFPVTLLFGFLLIVQLVLKRKADINLYKRMR